MNLPGCSQHLATAERDPPAEGQHKSKPQSLRSEGLGNTAASEIKLRREVPPGSLMIWSQTVCLFVCLLVGWLVGWFIGHKQFKSSKWTEPETKKRCLIARRGEHRVLILETG